MTKIFFRLGRGFLKACTFGVLALVLIPWCTLAAATTAGKTAPRLQLKSAWSLTLPGQASESISINELHYGRFGKSGYLLVHSVGRSIVGQKVLSESAYRSMAVRMAELSRLKARRPCTHNTRLTLAQRAISQEFLICASRSPSPESHQVAEIFKSALRWIKI